MKSIDISEIKEWERFYRANFINSLTGFKSVGLIGTANKNNQTNLGIFSSVVHIGSDPALIGYVNRPLKAAPHTLSNIESTGVYTINHIQENFIDKAHQTSAKYAEEISEFDSVGLTPEYINEFRAPFVKESIVKYALSLESIIPITLNDTFLVIGKVISVHLPSSIIGEDGFIKLDEAGSVCSNGVDAYYKTKVCNRFGYAKPDQPLKTIPS
jgi:flavin reductase (DIM6/NTAB) family NADH-FMN oxidoreductase RutF